MKPFGIASLVLSIIAIVTPFAGVFVAGLAGILAFFSAGKGTTLGLSAVIINIVNLIFLSPSLIISASNEHSINATHQAQSQTIFTTLLSIQIIAIIIFIVKSFLNKRTAF